MADTSDLYGRYPRVRCAAGQLTANQVNGVDSGNIIVRGESGRTLTVVGGWMRAIGGAAGACTSVDVKNTAGTPVVAVACTQGGLTENTIVRFGTPTTGEFNTANTTMGKGKGLQIAKTGSAMTTATAIDYCVLYTVSA